jgi:hypothetical protein
MIPSKFFRLSFVMAVGKNSHQRLMQHLGAYLQEQILIVLIEAGHLTQS